MIARYSRQQVKKIWSLENKFSLWLEIECLVAEKKGGHIKDFNATDVKSINLLALGASLKDVDRLRKDIDDARWPKMEKHMGLKKK